MCMKEVSLVTSLSLPKFNGSISPIVVIHFVPVQINFYS